MSRNSDFSRKENTLKILKNATFTPKPIKGCSHIKSFLTNDINPTPRFIATQIYDNSYQIAWYCKDCANKHNIPFPGVFIALDEYCSSTLDELIEYTRHADPDENPYQELFKTEHIVNIDPTEFKKFSHVPSVEEVMQTKYRIPFGILVKKIL